MRALSAVFAAALAAPMLVGIGPAQLVPPALAIDADFYCWDMDNGDLECQEVEDLQAECSVVDPGNESDVCKDVNENEGVGFGRDRFSTGGSMGHGMTGAPAFGATFSFGPAPSSGRAGR